MKDRRRPRRIVGLENFSEEAASRLLLADEEGLPLKNGEPGCLRACEPEIVCGRDDAFFELDVEEVCKPAMSGGISLPWDDGGIQEDRSCKH